MNEQHHGNLLGGAVGETTQTAAQLATIAATAAQVAILFRVRQLEAEQFRDQSAADTERAVLRNEHAAARLAWAPALEHPFITTASATEAATMWAAAQPWADHDTSAGEAARRAEERLGILHPDLIDRYGQGLADGMDPVDAMVEASAVLVPPGDVSAAEVARAVAGAERGEALRESAVPDVATTVSVDEHTLGVQAGAAHAAVSDATSARAVLLAAQAYPQPLQGTLGGDARSLPARAVPVHDLRRWRGR